MKTITLTSEQLEFIFIKTYEQIEELKNDITSSQHALNDLREKKSKAFNLIRNIENSIESSDKELKQLQNLIKGLS